MVRRKRGRDSIASVTLATVLSGGEGSSGNVIKRSRSLDPEVFSSFVDSHGVGHPSTYLAQLNANNTPHDANVSHMSDIIYAPSWEYRCE